ncbi:hypothetical protein FRB99_000091 [Tulasnella sp. 403]|nr:hypothetical protein FRB99_000091 [Tulasnella sp. 403]
MLRTLTIALCISSYLTLASAIPIRIDAAERPYALWSSSSKRDSQSAIKKDEPPQSSFASVVMLAQAQTEDVTSNLSNTPSPDAIAQTLSQIDGVLTSATDNLSHLSTESASVIHAGITDGLIDPNVQLSDEELARLVASLVFTVSVPLQPAITDPDQSSTLQASLDHTMTDMDNLLQQASSLIPGILSLVQPLLRPVTAILEALHIDISSPPITVVH